MSATSDSRIARGGAATSLTPPRRSRKGSVLASVQVLAGLLVVAMGVWWVTNSSLFDMRSLEVSGNLRLSDGELRRLSGLSRRTNVLWLSPRSVERRLLASPWISSADVSRTLPGHVSLGVRERRPVGVLVAAEKYLVAADGTVLAEAEGLPVLPTFQLPDVHVAVGRAIDLSRSPPLAALADVPAQLRKLVKTASDREGEGVTLTLRDSTRVLYGAPTEGVAKARALVELIAWARRNGVEPAYIDVRVPDAPALRPA